MREEYDFSNAVKNPYVGKLKQQITIRLDEQVIDYFKKMALMCDEYIEKHGENSL